MAVPTSYTETTLKTYCHAVLGATADVLEWTVIAGDYDETVNEALLRYGTNDVTSISGISNIVKIRSLVRRHLWAHVMDEVATDYNVEDESGRNDRRQVHAMAKENYRRSVDECMAYDPDYNVEIETVDYDDPYEAYDENDV